MKHALLKKHLLSSCVALTISSQVVAQDDQSQATSDNDALNFEEIVVTGQIVTRNRTASG